MDTDQLIGLTIEQARTVAAENKRSIRIRREDGKSYIGTDDFDGERINVEVREGRVVEVLGVG